MSCTKCTERVDSQRVQQDLYANWGSPQAGPNALGLALKERTTRTGRPFMQDSFSALFMFSNSWSKLCTCAHYGSEGQARTYVSRDGPAPRLYRMFYNKDIDAREAAHRMFREDPPHTLWQTGAGKQRLGQRGCMAI